MSEIIKRLDNDLDVLMERINCRVGPEYRLTLICRYDGADLDDADILKTNDDFDMAVAALRRLQSRDPL